MACVLWQYIHQYSPVFIESRRTSNWAAGHVSNATYLLGSIATAGLLASTGVHRYMHQKETAGVAPLIWNHHTVDFSRNNNISVKRGPVLGSANLYKVLTVAWSKKTSSPDHSNGPRTMKDGKDIPDVHRQLLLKLANSLAKHSQCMLPFV
jgi:hypothetical protein